MNRVNKFLVGLMMVGFLVFGVVFMVEFFKIGVCYDLSKVYIFVIL